ncbi:MAG: gamma-glutamyltransferase family protein [Gammaproteobacteria bacterium]|nr:gamma-glutamyltransferase family protein [Gammaproteobacteria bacterium]
MYEPDLPYDSRRAPVAADNLVATSQPLAAQAGLDMLRRGGNAVDAALAAAIALTVVEPTSNGIGSDAFALLWDGTRLVGINGSGRAPAQWTLERFAGRTSMPRTGWDAVTVPGAVSVWVALSDAYGRLPFAELFAPAIHYARDGFAAGPITAHYWRQDLAQFADFPEFQRHFGPAPAAGARVRLPDAARSLEEIAASKGESFYRGDLAARIARAAAAEGGALGLADLAAHRADWVTPIAQPYRDVVLHEIPPNGQGLAAQIALGILARRAPPARDSVDAMHLQIEAMKLALGAAWEHFADPAAMRLSPEDLLEPGALDRAAARIGPRALPVPPVSLPVSLDTVYLCAADASGMMVSFIQSNFHGFGSGVVVPGTGIALQNRGYGFSLDPAHPNCVAPGKRPFHTIIPGFLTRDGQPLAAFGVMGGHMQAQGHVQMVTRLVDYGQNPQAASDAPRWRVEPDFSVALEASFAPAVAEELAARGHRVVIDAGARGFGGAQIAWRTASGYVGGSDHRKEGAAVGF